MKKLTNNMTLALLGLAKRLQQTEWPGTPSTVELPYGRVEQACRGLVRRGLAEAFQNPTLPELGAPSNLNRAKYFRLNEVGKEHARKLEQEIDGVIGKLTVEQREAAIAVVEQSQTVKYMKPGQRYILWTWQDASPSDFERLGIFESYGVKTCTDATGNKLVWETYFILSPLGQALANKL